MSKFTGTRTPWLLKRRISGSPSAQIVPERTCIDRAFRDQPRSGPTPAGQENGPKGGFYCSSWNRGAWPMRWPLSLPLVRSVLEEAVDERPRYIRGHRGDRWHGEDGTGGPIGPTAPRPGSLRLQLPRADRQISSKGVRAS